MFNVYIYYLYYKRAENSCQWLLISVGTVFQMIQRRRNVPGTAVLVTIRWTERGWLFFVRVEWRHTTAVVIIQPRLETRGIATTARMLRPKVKVLLVELAVVVPDDDHIV